MNDTTRSCKRCGENILDYDMHYYSINTATSGERDIVINRKIKEFETCGECMNKIIKLIKDS